MSTEHIVPHRDVDAIHSSWRAAGLAVTPLGNKAWGMRELSVTDPAARGPSRHEPLTANRSGGSMRDGNVVRASVWRRVGATCVDYGFVAAWGLALAALAVGVGAHVRFAALSPGGGQLLGIATMTAPATVAIALAEACGGRLGKRLLGLRLETVCGERVRPGTALLRGDSGSGLGALVDSAASSWSLWERVPSPTVPPSAQ